MERDEVENVNGTHCLFNVTFTHLFVLKKIDVVTKILFESSCCQLPLIICEYPTV